MRTPAICVTVRDSFTPCVEDEDAHAYIEALRDRDDHDKRAENAADCRKPRKHLRFVRTPATYLKVHGLFGMEVEGQRAKEIEVDAQDWWHTDTVRT